MRALGRDEVERLTIETGGLVTSIYEIVAVADDAPPAYLVGDFAIHESSIASEIHRAPGELYVVCPHQHIAVSFSRDALIEYVSRG